MASGLNFHERDVFQRLEIRDVGDASIGVTKDYAATMRLKQGWGNGKTQTGAAVFALGVEGRYDAAWISLQGANRMVRNFPLVSGMITA